MATFVKEGEHIFIPFRNGVSISNSQCIPRMYKTEAAANRYFPKHNLGINGVKFVEYEPVKRGKWIDVGKYDMDFELSVQLAVKL